MTSSKEKNLLHDTHGGILKKPSVYYQTSTYPIEMIHQFRTTFYSTMSTKFTQIENAPTKQLSIQKIRSVYLYLLRNHSLMTETRVYYDLSHLIYVAFARSKVIQKEIEVFMEDLTNFNKNYPFATYTKDIRYSKMVIKTLQNWRNLIVQDFLRDYGKMPGHLPLCIRSYIMTFILPPYFVESGR